MKRFALFAFLMIAGGFCFADASGPQPAYMYETAVSSGSTLIITVSTSVVTQMDNPQLFNRAAIEIQNIDSSASLWCVVISSITPTVPSTNNGRKIAAGGSWFPNFLSTITTLNYSSSTTPNITTTQTSAKIWCISDGAASTKAAVTQAY